MDFTNDDFDPVEYDSKLGLTETASFGNDANQLQVDPNLRASLGTLASQQPQGITTTGEQNPPAQASDVPEYLTAHIVQAPAEQPAAINWQERYQQAFGTEGDQPSEFTQDAFESEVIFRNYSDQFLQSQEHLPYYEGIIAAPETDNIRIVTDEVTALMHQQNRRSQRAIDEELEVYIQDGELTDEGKKFIGTVRTNAQRAADGIYQKASEYAQQVQNDYTAFKNEQIEQVKSFAPFGIPLSETTQARMLDRSRSGAVDEWLNKPAETVKEQVRRSLLLALVSDEAALSEWVKGLDQRGVKHGRGQKIASNLQ